MSGAGIEILVKTEGLRNLSDRIARLERSGQAKLLRMIAALHRNQVETRIMEEKTGPDGKAWAPWKQDYEKTRDGRHSLLVSGDAERKGKQTHSLHSSIIEEMVNHALALVGSPLVYAATHQYGRGAIEARPFLGFSDANFAEVESLIGDWLDGQLQGAV